MVPLSVLLLLICLLTGCAATHNAAHAPEVSPRIELLGFESCPNMPVLLDRATQAVRQIDPSIRVVQVDQESLPEDDLRRGYPAPTLLVNGRDLFGMAPPKSSGLGCRRYEGPGGVPAVDEIARRLRAMDIEGGDH